MVGFDIEILLKNEEMRKKLNEENRKRAERWLKKLKNISEAHRRYLEKIASGEWEVW